MNKLDALRAAAEKAGADAILLTSEEAIRYATDFVFQDGYVLILRDAAYLVTDFRYKEAAEKAVDDSITVEAPPSRLAFLTETLTQNKIRALAYEDAALSVSLFHRYTDALTSDLLPFSGELSSLRSVKSPEEIRRIEAAQALTDAAFTHILGYITPDKTETDVALELELYMRKNGAERTSFETIAVSGRQSALPHGTPRPVRLESGFLTMDFGCVVDGYMSDMTRTLSIGKATDGMRKLYATVLAAQKAALSTVRAGISCKAVDTAARSLIDNAGYAGLFGHSTGHGVGLYIHEEPTLSSLVTKPLVCGHVVTVEPGIYVEGKYGCRIEDLVVVTETGCRNLTKSTKELIEIL